MAKKIHWQIQFKSITDNLYTVNIYDEYNGDPVQLTGAAQPFVTQEDSNEDAFLPVRTSTGYMSFIVNSIEEARAIIPQNMTDRFVSLTGNNRVYWEGFIKPEAFSCDWKAGPIEISLPVVSILEAAKSVTYTPTYERRSFDALYLKCLSLTLGNYYRLAHFTRITPNDSLTTFFVNDSVFAPSEEYEWVKYNGYRGNTPDLKDQISCYDVIAEICKYCGWSVREINGVMNFAKVSTAIDGPAYNLPEVASTDNTFDILPGKKMISITEMVSGPKSMIDTNWNHFSAEDAQIYDNDNTWIQYPNQAPLMVAYQYDANGNLLAENTDILANSHFASGTRSGAEFVKISFKENSLFDMFISNFDRDLSGFTNAVAMVHKNFSGAAAFTIRSRIPYDSRDFPLGIKVTGEWLSAGVVERSKWDKHLDGIVLPKVKWGDKYFWGEGNSHNEWTSTEHTCQMRIGQSGTTEGSGKLHYNHLPFGDWWLRVDNGEAVLIPAPTEPIHGYIEISFPVIPYNSSDGIGASLIKNLDIQPISYTDIAIDSFTDLTENRWRIMNNNFEEGYEMSCKLFSRMSEQQVGAGVVTTEEGSYPIGPKFGPYGGLADRLALWYNRSIEQITVKTRPAGNASFKVFSINGKKYLNTSLSTNWRDEEETLILQKIDEEE